MTNCNRISHLKLTPNLQPANANTPDVILCGQCLARAHSGYRGVHGQPLSLVLQFAY